MDTRSQKEARVSILNQGLIGTLPRSLQCAIVRTVFDFVKKSPWSERRQLRNFHVNLLTVSKELYSLTTEVINEKCAPLELLSPGELRCLKVRAGALCLMPVVAAFWGSVWDEWGNQVFKFPDEMQENMDEVPVQCLEMLVKKFGGTTTSFVKLVITEYKRFLVVKAVEALAARSPAVLRGAEASIQSGAANFEGGTNDLEAWRTRCCPTKLVDMMWHEHLRTPQYQSDCKALTAGLGGGSAGGKTKDTKGGFVIEHDEGYISDAARGTPSTVDAKIEALFEFELGLEGSDDRELFDCVYGKSIEDRFHGIWQDMVCYNDCG